MVTEFFFYDYNGIVKRKSLQEIRKAYIQKKKGPGAIYKIKNRHIGAMFKNDKGIWEYDNYVDHHRYVINKNGIAVANLGMF